MRSSKEALFRRATNAEKPALPHPTSNQFDVAAWRTAIESLPTITPDDQALFDAACIMADQIGRLRPHFLQVFDGLPRSTAVMLIAAFANREFNTVQRKSVKAIGRAVKDGPRHLEILTDLQLESGNPAAQKTNADSAVESVVDCLPHALFHANQLGEFEVQIAEQRLARRAAAIISATSLERAYRVLWQSCLWNGDAPRVDGDEAIFEQSNVEAEERWQAWIVRSAATKMEGGFNKGLFHADKKALPEEDRIVKRTISGIERRAGFRNGPVVVNAKRFNDVQRHLAAKWLTLKESYLSSFLDVPFPKAPNLSISLLAKAWWVLGELCEIFINEMGTSKLASLVSLRKQSFPVKRDVLVETLANAIQVELGIAKEIVDFLAADTSDLTRLFNRGLWGNPLLKAPRGDKFYLIAPVLVIGDWVRAGEFWMEQGGGTEGVALRGPQFELQCRQALSTSLQANAMLSSAACPTVGLPEQSDGEQIDCLVRIGSTVLVCECKCFLTPTEPIERFNFIERLNDGCEQAARKTQWLRANSEVAAAALGCSREECATMTYFGVLLTNQSYGVGHIHVEVPVVDLKYLDLLCGGGSYWGETMYDRENFTGVSLSKHLYSSQAELERRLPSLLCDPVVMRRFKDRFDWVRFPVPSMSTLALVNLVPVLKELPEDRAQVDQLKKMLEAQDK